MKTRHASRNRTRSAIAGCILLLSILMPNAIHAKQRFQKPGPVHLDRKGERWARESLQKMSLEQKIGQMFVIWARVQFMNVDSPEYIRLRDTMRKYHIGAFGLSVGFEDGFLYKNQPLEAAWLTNQLQKDSEFPLIFAADFERGLGFRLDGVTSFPHAMAFGATGNTGFARESARITAEEARAIGVQWNWFPVADVNSNPLNPIINIRSFGEDPKLVSDMDVAYIEEAHQYGMLTTAKHFPGHGDTDIDSHLDLPYINHDRQQLEQTELPPFQAAIAAGVNAVMLAHVRVPALDPDPHRVASTSPVIVTGLLKDQMGFHGLVITDALNMAAVMQLYPESGTAGMGRAAVEAVKAGNDVLLSFSELENSYNGLLLAVRSGEIPESRIDESVLKILRAKASVGLNRATQVDIDAVNRIVAKPESLATAQEIADSAVTLVRDNHRVLPLLAASPGTKPGQTAYQPAAEKANQTVLLIFTDDSRSDMGRVLDHKLKLRLPQAKVFYIDSRNASGMASAVTSAVRQADKVIAAVYLTPQGGAKTNRTALPGESAAVLEDVLRNASPKTAVIAMGNPYIAAQLPEIQTYLCTFSDAQVSEMSAGKAIFGEIPLSGHLPVTIPNVADRGAGISKPASSGGPP